MIPAFVPPSDPRLRAAVLLTASVLALAACRQEPTAASPPPSPPSPPPAAASAPLFVDGAAETGLQFVYFNGMSGERYFVEMMGGGVALFDYDNDGDLDLYAVQGAMLGEGKSPADATFPPEGPLPPSDRLFRNDLEILPDGTHRVRFTDVTEEAGIHATGYGIGVTAGDYDNDGWTDLYVADFGSNVMLHNNGDGTFTDTTVKTGTDDRRWTTPTAFFDYDRDGWLDLYVGNYVDFTLATQKVCRSETGAPDYCSPLAYSPVTDRLFHNRGDGTFEDVSARSRIGSQPGNALGAIPADLDGDGWLDLYVANDGMANFMWLNQKDGTFKDDALLAGTAVNSQGQAQASMGVDAADFDGDGDEDLFMAHLTRESNTIYKNAGGGVFDDVSVETGLAQPSWGSTGFGTSFFDYDNDGLLDVFVANGAVTNVESQVAAGDPYPLHQPNQLYHNDGGRFREVTASAGPVFALSEVSRGAAFGDVDNDGDVDIVVLNSEGPLRLLLNQVGNRRHWVGLRLVGGRPPRDMLGAWVGVFRPDGKALYRRVRTAGSFASANDPRLLVGLGDAAAVERVEVLWPDGSKEVFRQVQADRYTTLVKGTGQPAAEAR